MCNGDMSDSEDSAGADEASAPEPPPKAPVNKPGDRRKPPFVFLAIVVVAAMVGGYLFFSGGGEAQAGEIFLEPASSEGPFPWTGSVAAPDAPASVPLPTPSAIPTQFADPDAPAKPPTVRVTGDRTGIYGGSLDRAVCDVGKLVGFLEQNPDKARAFASVLNISPRDIKAYVESLTPVILGADTVVTNHGYKDGRPTPRQSVLQAGTAVLVDDRGVPRVRCYCGNPLLPPAAIDTPPVYVGTRWPDFNPARVIIIQPAPVQITQITVINVFEGGTVVVPVAAQPQSRPVETRPPPTPSPDQPLRADGTYRLVPGTSSCEDFGSVISSITISVAGTDVTLGAEGESLVTKLLADGAFLFDLAPTDGGGGGGFLDFDIDGEIRGRFVQSGSTVSIQDGQVLFVIDGNSCTANFTGERTA